MCSNWKMKFITCSKPQKYTSFFSISKLKPPYVKPFETPLLKSSQVKKHKYEYLPKPHDESPRLKCVKLKP
jgi:hypothetical protein